MPNHERVAEEIAKELVGTPVERCERAAVVSILRREYGDARRDALEEAVCEWRQEDEWDFSDVWDTACGQAFCFIEDGAPGKDGIDFCCYCGKPIKPIPAKEEAHE
jgi:hypothetical protein